MSDVSPPGGPPLGAPSPPGGPREPSSSEVDELFGEGGGAPQARVPLALALLLLGLLLAVVGLPCSTAPGGALVLLSWLVIEKDVDRLESGYLPADATPGLRTARLVVRLGVLVVIGLTAIQAVMVCGLFYPDGWGRFLFWMMGIGELEPPPAP